MNTMRWFALIALGVVAVTLAACSSATSTTGVVGPGTELPRTDVLDPSQPGVSDLPEPSKLPSLVDIFCPGFVFGSQHDSSLPRWNYRYIGEYRLGLDPAGGTAGQDTALVIFPADLATFTHNSHLNLYWQEERATGDAWVGMANYTDDRWDWYQVPAGNQITFDPAVHIRGGMAWFAVVVTGSEEWVLDHVWFGDLELPVINAVTPTYGREGEVVTMQAVLRPGSGAVDSWNWNFGGATTPGHITVATAEVTLGPAATYTCEVTATNAAGSSNMDFRLNIQESWTTWDVVAVAGGLENMVATSLALADDSGGQPHIACSTEDDIFYYRPESLSWWEIAVAHTYTSDMDMSNTSLAVNSIGHPYLAYTKGHSAVFLFWYDESEWHFDTPFSSVGPGYDRRCHDPRIALDSSGLPQISFQMTEFSTDWDADYVCHMYNDGTAWLSSPVIATSGGLMETGTIGRMVPLILDSEDTPFVAWFNSDPKSISITQFDAGWHDDVIDSVHTTRQISVDMDSAENPHVAYTVLGVPDQIYYAASNGVGWDSGAVPSAINIADDISLKLDSNDEPHIAYYNSSNGDLHMVYREGTDWFNVRVEALNDIGRGCSLAIDDADTAHISFFDSTLGVLKYAVEPTP